MEHAELTIENVCGDGAVAEVFEHYVADIMKNIADPNTQNDAPRKLTLEFTFKPTKSHDYMAVSLDVKTKLASIARIEGGARLVRKDGRLSAMALEGQPEIFSRNVKPIAKGE
jgi:hypothetical protein